VRHDDRPKADVDGEHVAEETPVAVEELQHSLVANLRNVAEHRPTTGAARKRELGCG
jgi:hypothetical protein